MKYELRNSRTGEKAVYKTTVDIADNGKEYVFTFEVENTQYYCPYQNYNDIHSYGDACEILIGTDPNRKEYYEMEISPEGKLMLAKMTYRGIGDQETKEPDLGIDFVDEKDCFIRGEAKKTEKGYIASFRVCKKALGDKVENIYFNAYRLETDGGELNKHLFALNPVRGDWFHAPDKYVWLKDYL